MQLNGYVVISNEGIMHVDPIIEDIPVKDLKRYSAGVLWVGEYGTLFTGTENNARRAALRSIARTKAYCGETGLKFDWLSSLKAVPTYAFRLLCQGTSA